MRTGPSGVIGPGEKIQLKISAEVDETIVLFMFSKGEWRINPGAPVIDLDNPSGTNVIYFVMIIPKWTLLVPTPQNLFNRLLNRIKKTKIKNGINHE